jgi:hypothetical protein
VGQLDGQADRLPAGLCRALVGGGHDARSTAGDDRDAASGERAGQLLGGVIHRAVVRRPRRAEDADRRAQPRQRFETLDELAHDAQRPPGVAVEEGGVGVRRGPQQLAVFARLGVSTAFGRRAASVGHAVQNIRSV